MGAYEHAKCIACGGAIESCKVCGALLIPVPEVDVMALHAAWHASAGDV